MPEASVDVSRDTEPRKTMSARLRRPRERVIDAPKEEGPKVELQ
jgi:hypothetical protein